MNDFLSFRKMITPTVIQIIFWIGVVYCVIVGIVMIAAGVAGSRGGGAMVLSGVASLILGPLFVRVWCELVIILFRVHDRLGEIRDNTSPKQ